MNMKFTVGKATPTIDYKGKAYHFCCDHCIADFRKAPDKYASATAAAMPVRKVTQAEIGKAAKCAVMGTEFSVGPETAVIDYEGKPYYFCCDHCVADFQAKPEKYALK
jgi:Cu+-exporting ATPase